MASWRESVSPYSGGTVPDLHRVPSPRSVVPASYTIRRCPLRCDRHPARPYRRGSRSSRGRPSSSRSPRCRAWAPTSAWDTILRKLAHVAEYAILGALLLRAVRRPGLAVALGVVYAASDEVHQMFVEGRHGAPLDVVIDAAGLLVGIIAWRRLASRASRPKH